MLSDFERCSNPEVAHNKNGDTHLIDQFDTLPDFQSIFDRRDRVKEEDFVLQQQ